MAITYQRSCAAMGTRFEVFLRGADEQHLEAVAVAVCEEIQRLDETLSRFHPGSEIARINRTAGSRAVRVEREVFALLERCEQARQQTHGYFNVAAATGGAALELDAAVCTVRFTETATQLDLGAIGKGYALDCGFEILTRFGIEAALLNGGTSSVRALGGPWPVALRHPWRTDDVAEQLTLTNQALSCSATRHPDQTTSDVLNPLTGAPLTGAAACVVYAANATDAEIFSTALLAMGQTQANAFLAHCAERAWQVNWL